MKSMSDITAQKIKAYLEVFIENILSEYKDKNIDDFKNSKIYFTSKSNKSVFSRYAFKWLPTSIFPTPTGVPV